LFNFVPYSEPLREEWDRFVQANPEAWAGHSSSILEFERLLGNETRPYLARDDQGKVVGVIPLIITRTRRAPFLPVITTLGSGSVLRGAPLIESSWNQRERERFWDSFAKWAVSFGATIGCHRIRLSFPHFLGPKPIHEVYRYLPLLDHGFTAPSNLTLILDLASCKDDLMRVLDGKCRNLVRRARDGGASFSRIVDKTDWLSCFELNLQTFRENDCQALSEKAFDFLWDGFVARGLAEAFAVRYEGQPVSAALTVGTRWSHYYWYGFNRQPRCPLPGVGNLLVFEILRYHQEKGMPYFELGSLNFGSQRVRRIAAFKEDFGGRPRHGMMAETVLAPWRVSLEDFEYNTAKSIRANARGAWRRLTRHGPM
jgi:hypothetical protein